MNKGIKDGSDAINTLHEENDAAFIPLLTFFDYIYLRVSLFVWKSKYYTSTET